MLPRVRDLGTPSRVPPGNEGFPWPDRPDNRFPDKKGTGTARRPS